MGYEKSVVRQAVPGISENHSTFYEGETPPPAPSQAIGKTLHLLDSLTLKMEALCPFATQRTTPNNTE
jgi:hypothetical protein